MNFIRNKKTMLFRYKNKAGNFVCCNRNSAKISSPGANASYCAIFNSVNDMVVVHDLKTGRPVDLNEAVVKRFGWTKAEFLRLQVEDWSEGHSPYSKKEAQQWIAKTAAGKPQLFEWLCRTKNGELFWAEVSLKLAKISGKERVLAVVRDISDRKKTEAELQLYRKHLEDLVKERTAALQESWNQYKTILKNIPGIVYRRNKDCSIETFGKHFAAITGYSVREWQRKKKKWFDIIHSADRNEFFQQRQLLLKRPCFLHQDYRICKRDGEVIWISDHKKSVFQKGKFISTDGIITNIDAHKKAEEKLMMFKTTVDKANFGIAMTDLEGNFAYVNNAFATMHHFSPQELIGKSLRWLSSPGTAKVVHAFIEEARKKDVIAREMWHQRKDHSRFPVLIHFFLLSNYFRRQAHRSRYKDFLDKKYPQYLTLTAIDISERKKVEQQIEEQVKQLKGLDLLKNQFLSNVSHELRTPLTPIISQIQRMMAKELSREEEKTSLDMVLKNTLRLDKMINEVLEISRIQSGKMILSKRKTNLRELIQQVATTMGRFARDRNCFITLTLAPLPLLEIDPERISSVLINLIDNAIKFDGGSEILVTAEKISREVIVGVRDHGIGIAPRDFPKIFTPFFRSEETHVYRGCGLGLSICKGIVEAHNGKIWFESKLGEGSTFYFSLPLKTKISKILLTKTRKKIH